MNTSVEFTGTKLSENMWIGFFNSSELITKFSSQWIPEYQRDRVMIKSKIEDLKKLYSAGSSIGSIKVAFIGDVVRGDSGRTASLNGKFSVIDGQQRLYALQESKAKGIRIPVEVFLNMREDEEIKLFNQYNTKATRLKSGDIVKSCSGSFGTLNKKILKYDTLPIKVSVNKSKVALPLASLCRLEYMIHKKLNSKVKQDSLVRPNADQIHKFLSDSFLNEVVLQNEFALKNLLQEYVEKFGEFDNRSTAYMRTFFFAWQTMVVQNFLMGSGQIDFSKFKNKAKQVSVQAVKSSRIKELCSGGGDLAHSEVYKILIDLMNFRNNTNLLEVRL